MACNVYQHVVRVGISQKAINQMVSSVLLGIKHSDASMSVHLIGDTRMRTLNRRFRGKDKTTDVLSFSTNEGAEPFLGEDWGDVFVSIPQIRRQAKQFSVPFREEFYRMLVHGTLHLFGYDHEQDEEAKKMFRLQEKFVHAAL